MSRLYDRAIAGGIQALPGCANPILENEQAKALYTMLPLAEVISADNVTHYYFEGTEQEDWDWEADFPNVAPPFMYMWMETRCPRWSNSATHGRVDLRNQGGYPSTWGAFAAGGPSSKPEVEAKLAAATGEKVEWYLHMMPVIELAKGEIYGPMGTYVLAVSKSGAICKRRKEGGLHPGVFLGESHEVRQSAELLLQPFLLALSFMHCKNVSLDLNEPPNKPSRKHERRHGRPLTSYYTLEIEPMKQTLRSEGRSDEVGLQRALHICRGHFATYSPEKPLFGKYSGTFWKPQHIKGSKKSGEIVKDYAIKSPKEGA